jgi:hypothetical protein
MKLLKIWLVLLVFCMLFWIYKFSYWHFQAIETRWSNDGRSSEWHGCVQQSKYYWPDGTNGGVELGYRNDGVVVWRKEPR